MMINYSDTIIIAEEVNKICSFFLDPRDIAYFQFKRIYKNCTNSTLANHAKFFREFWENGFIEPTLHRPIYTRQSFVLFWDESLSSQSRTHMEEALGIYHGISIIGRHRGYYDCTSFAMTEPHPSPFTYYTQIMIEFQRFAEIFPTIARHLILNVPKKNVKPLNVGQNLNHCELFLPKRSVRYQIGKNKVDYITTYEALCAQLFLECKSYKEIGSVLSIAPSTVETHLRRLKERTGLSMRDISLQSFQELSDKKKLFQTHPKEKVMKIKRESQQVSP